MNLNVHIVSRETIKPFSPTPPEKRFYNHSLLDQLTAIADVDCVLFYPKSDKLLLPAEQIHDKLKLSLSTALAHFYPLAGRGSDSLSITCNDQGVSYVEARASQDMSRVIANPGAPHHPLSELVPKEQLANLIDEDRALLSVQTTTFTCGGLAIGVRVSHTIADASALASFLTHWADFSRDPSNNVDGEGIVADVAALFPPRNFRRVRFTDIISPDKAQSERTVKRFVFDGPKIASLRDRFAERRPTRFEALSTLLWATIIGILQEKKPQFGQTTSKSHIAFSPMNLRKRIDPPLPDRSLGSTLQAAVAKWPMNKTVDLDELVGKLSDSIRYLNDPDIVKDIHNGDKCFGASRAFRTNVVNDDLDLLITFSSWCRFPLYETDFGWGKPDMVGVSFPLYVTNVAVFIDAKDGEGIEVWVGLAREDMAKFEQNHDILQYATF